MVYRGPIISYPGFISIIGIIRDRRVLSWTQKGIDLGLNGMAVGGRRRITIDRKLICSHVAESAPHAFCDLTTAPPNPIEVYKRTLIVEATLTESCNPVITWQGLYLFGGYLIKLQACREESRPTIDPSAPIWHYYDR